MKSHSRNIHLRFQFQTVKKKKKKQEDEKAIFLVRFNFFLQHQKESEQSKNTRINNRKNHRFNISD